MTPRRGARTPVFLWGLLKLLVIVVIAGGIGFALGTGLSALSEENDPAAPIAETGTAAPPATQSTPTVASLSPTPPTQTTATQRAPSSPLAQVRVSVLDARLHTDETPSGRREQRARVTVRIRAANEGNERLALPRPILRVGSVRVPAGAGAGAPGTQFDPLAAGASQTVTLQFELSGEATPKVVRDRRARLLIAGRSVPLRVALRTPTR